MKLTAIVVTLNRPDCLRRCLECLEAQQPQADQIIVVDASVDEHTRELMARFPQVLYLRNAGGRGNTPNSRNIALRYCTGDILAFLDDDAFAHPGWVANLLETYADHTVACVAGRALNNVPGEESAGIHEIGKIRSNGTIAGNFAANPGNIVDVDHMIGCNMSLRRDVMAHLGGFRDDFRAGPFGICEETEICFRAKRLGYRLVYNPSVCVDHIGAPQTGGRRFSPKYEYYHVRNNLVMVLRNGGNVMIARFLLRSLWETAFRACGRFLSALTKVVCNVGGIVAGLCIGTYLVLSRGRDATRHDRGGEEIRLALIDPGGISQAPPTAISCEVVTSE